MSNHPSDPASALRSLPDILYGSGDGVPLYLDMLQPDPRPERPMPTVIFIMGGGWMRKNRKVNFTPFLASAGFTTISIDHRTSDEALFPAQLADAKAAVRWVRANVEHYYLDPERIGVWGISSGAHLAALLGVSGDVPELEGMSGSPTYSSRVGAVATISAPVDLSQLGGERIDSAEARLLGGLPRDRLELARLANPITYLGPDLLPFLMFHGDQDDVVPIRQSEQLYVALRDAGAEATFVPLPGEGHMLGDIYDEQVEPMIREFFVEHLRL